MKKFLQIIGLCFAACLTQVQQVAAQTNYDYSVLQRESLGRGLFGVRKSNTQTFIAWRYLSSDPIDITFNIYKKDVLLQNTAKTSFIDKDYTYKNDVTYTLIPVVDGVEQTEDAATYTIKGGSANGYLSIPLEAPIDELYAEESGFQYNANDASLGDVDGDGEYEIFLKWDPSNSQDNANSGKTGKVFIDCYKLDGTRLWRIDLGRNIRAGAHYTQFMVYDFDGDGKAEIIMKTADGTVDGLGNVIGDISKDYRNSEGRILEGPEFLTIFNGETGEAMATVDYIPNRYPINGWGSNESYGNRVDRFLACVAYLDGVRPSAVMCRGYYGRSVLAAWDWDGETLTNKWIFDSNVGYSSYAGQGNHNLRVGDVDGDGCDEIIYGQCTIDHDGKGLYTTRKGHGDALHMTVFDPSSEKLAVWGVHENKVDGSTFRDAATGQILQQVKSADDVGRGMAADIDPRYKGVEMWSSRSGGILNINGKVVNGSTSGVSMNMAAWWDGGLLRNLQDGTSITRYNYLKGIGEVLLSASGCASNNSTKSNPCLVADIVGDWREELLLRAADNSELRLYINTDTIDYRFHTFLEDPVYRLSVAYQNVAYNQPTHVGFYFGADLGTLLESHCAEQTCTLDAGMTYDAYQWFIDGKVVGQERQLKVQVADIPENGFVDVVLHATFRGYIFEETIRLDANSLSIRDTWLSDLKLHVESDLLHIELPDQSESIKLEVYDMDGRRVYADAVADKNTSVPMYTWTSGVYIVKITGSEFTVSQKLVK